MASIAMDIGATKTLVALTKECKLQNIVNYKSSTKKKILENIDHAIASFDVKPESICAAIAGTIENGKIRQFTNFKGWKNFDLKNYLEKKYDVPASIINDGDASAIAEMKNTGYKNLIALTLGTGLGSGVIKEGKLIEGVEMGHIIIKKDGTKCACGSSGCLEAYTCTAAVERLVLKHYISGFDNIRLKQKYDEGDVQAKEIYQKIGSNLAAGVTSMINTFHPDAIVFAGGLINKEIFESMKSNVDKTLYSCPELLMSKMTKYSSLVGAMLVAEYEY